MLHGVQLRDVEVLTHVQLLRYVLVLVEGIICLLQCTEGGGCVNLELREVDEIDDGLNDGENFVTDSAGNQRHEHTLHLLVLLLCPPLNVENAFLEVPEPRCISHCLKPLVKPIFSNDR